ncbi:hypothetical protein HOG17_02270 [Candidatus Peregrinibacteria bacterium]|jgi:hypothetical protein|nr:hypothetical protein [Candidatus Peregrinibacteria bacterium]MBT4147742.1 hypothetical protein [Candidatus Peregrinibacteria bacterium]MBT4365947.1 hypothetical protein [Candidatus Peregrinibacteria bacterium]MBT4456572.1 hypothetical protein [Candidatus Peregrinibacteria bacterium]
MKFEEACFSLDEMFEVDPGTVIEVVRRNLRAYGMVGPRTTSKCLIHFDTDDWVVGGAGEGASLRREDYTPCGVQTRTRIFIKETASTGIDMAAAKASDLDMSDPKNFSEALRRFPKKGGFDVTVA